MNRAARWVRNPTVQAACAVWVLFFVLTATERFAFALFADGWFMSLTMVFGSLIAGSTSEGGGAVAFPVMTLLFRIEPPVARDFSLMIQTVGMVAAGWTILRLKIPVARQALLWSSLGGALGVCLGISVVAPLLGPASVKLFFVSLWLSFGAALLWVNRARGRTVAEAIAPWGARQRGLLVGAGLVGGCVSGLTGSGLDIVTFALLTLAFGVSEKIATPTSVVLMGINAAVGFAWRATAGAVSLGPIASQAWDYWYCCIAVVVIGAPLGARFIATRSRAFVVGLLLTSIALQFLGALLIVPGAAARWPLVLSTFAGGCALFGSMSWLGGRGDGSAAEDAPTRASSR